MFTLQATTGEARRGTLETAHGRVETPIFMPVGTQATVKGLTPRQVEEAGAGILLGNTYHLNLRPGPDLVREMGGLHRFMGWPGPILTDSGGFQVYSLAKLRRVSEEGIEFRSHIDGAAHFLGPESCFRIQDALGSDIAMVLDECPPYPCERGACEQAVGRTLRWAEAFLEHARAADFFANGRKIFGIVQGSVYDDLRLRCGEALASMDFSGYAVGGVSVGEPEEEMLRQVAVCAPVLPREKPRYVMGVGTPPQLLRMVGMGMDMFDCVMPTRLARHGTVFTRRGTLNLKNERFKRDPAPIMEADNYTCRHFSRAYLRHLLMAGEMLAGTLLSLHNIHFFVGLLAESRRRIEDGSFGEWSAEWIRTYRGGGA